MKNMKMKKGISGAAFIAIALVGLGIVATLFTTGGGSSLSKTDLPAVKASVIDTIEQIEKNQVNFYMNKNTYTGSFVTSSFKEGYISADSWTDKLRATCTTTPTVIADITAHTPGATDCFMSDKIKYYLSGNGDFFNLYVDLTEYSTEASIKKELESYVATKVKGRYGDTRVDQTATAMNSTEIKTATAADAAKDIDGMILMTVLKKY